MAKLNDIRKIISFKHLLLECIWYKVSGLGFQSFSENLRRQIALPVQSFRSLSYKDYLKIRKFFL